MIFGESQVYSFLFVHDSSGHVATPNVYDLHQRISTHTNAHTNSHAHAHIYLLVQKCTACVRGYVDHRDRERKERDVVVGGGGIICVKIYDDLALKAWTQRK